MGDTEAPRGSGGFCLGLFVLPSCSRLPYSVSLSGSSFTKTPPSFIPLLLGQLECRTKRRAAQLGSSGSGEAQRHVPEPPNPKSRLRLSGSCSVPHACRRPLGAVAARGAEGGCRLEDAPSLHPSQGSRRGSQSQPAHLAGATARPLTPETPEDGVRPTAPYVHLRPLPGLPRPRALSGAPERTLPERPRRPISSVSWGAT